MVSKPAQVVATIEADLTLPSSPRDLRDMLLSRFRAPPERLRVFGLEEWTAPVASGSSASESMIICPCSTGTLAAVASGMSRSLIERAADVAIKERRQLVLVVRETPFSEIHLEHMLKLARMGVLILPANPAFYHRPQTVEEIIDFVVARVLDHLRIPHNLVPRWGGDAKT